MNAPAKVLVVDDTPANVKLLADLLAIKGFAVATAANGEDALVKLAAEKPDLVLLDVMMPGLSGYDVCRRIRADPETALLPVVLVTSLDPQGERLKGIEAGADDYLTKPFAFAELLVRVKALLRRGPVTRSSVVRVADLELDRLSQQVKRAGKRIDLTAKEYSLLEYLMSNAGRVLSRTMIIEHVWDQSFDGITNIVDVYVRHLRNKVDDPYQQKLIRTIRGVGYSLGHGTQP